MIRTILLLVLMVVGQLSAQEQNQQAEVKNTIDVFFKGLQEGDTELMISVMSNQLILQTTYKNKDGKDVLSMEGALKLIQAIIDRPEDQKWEERLLDYKIQIDGNLAHVWTPYEFWLNGSFSHCGVNSFQLFNNNGTWKIIYLIDTRRKKDCN